MGLRDRNQFTYENCFFVTTSCHQRKHLLGDEPCFNILLDNFRFYNRRYHAHLVGYVLMINHLHFIIYFDERNYLSQYLRDFKKYTSIHLRKHFSSIQPDQVEGLRYEYRTQHFKVWEDRFDDVVLYSRAVCETKLNYLHENPVRAGLVNEPTRYRYSSASFYEFWKPGIRSELLHYRDVF